MPETPVTAPVPAGRPLSDAPSSAPYSSGAGEDAQVLVAGAGPAGLMLACELGLTGVRTLVLERHPAPPGYCRGFNLNARSLELLDLRGLADRFLTEGPTVPATAFAGSAQLDLTAMRTRHPYVLGIPQTRVEELLAEAGPPGRPRRLGGHTVGVPRRRCRRVACGAG
ncbi:hypothetical protein GCM10010430_05500 [Kitasatospora cystarginea]|uniref:FAD-binding domain-containing protein n=1 Tax=Kitasatospora cystarginea TaxID=58350 RepID=A0ABN3DE27_9ACTN